MTQCVSHKAVKETQTCACLNKHSTLIVMFVSQTGRLCNHVIFFYSHEVFVDVCSPERPDPPTDLELTDVKKRSVQLTWIPGDDHNSPIQCKCLLCLCSMHFDFVKN